MAQIKQIIEHAMYTYVLRVQTVLLKGMVIMYWLILALIVIPAIEVMVFIWTGDAIGIIAVFMIIILTGMIGVVLVRREGARTWQRLTMNIQQGIHPSNDILDGICIIVAGICLITPGFFTDIIGFLLVIPLTRKPFKWILVTAIARKIRKSNYIHYRR